MWQTDLPYFKIIGLGLELFIDDPRRLLALIISWNAPLHDMKERPTSLNAEIGATGVGPAVR